MFPWGRAALRGSVWKGVCWIHVSTHTPSITDTPLGWMENHFWKRMSVLSIMICLTGQIKRAFLLVFSNQNIPQILFAYLLKPLLSKQNIWCLCNGKGELKSSTPVIRGGAQEDLEHDGVILLQSINWKCPCAWRWIWLLSAAVEGGCSGECSEEWPLSHHQ